MRTVKQVADLAGISMRTLHYYDEIGLLKPTICSDNKYRLYDDKALEILQQILFFKAFDMPLNDIKAILDDPKLNRETILLSQRRMLEMKRDRLERLIKSIDGILQGDHGMDIAMFSENDSPKVQENFKKLIEWYGSEEEMMDAAQNPDNGQLMAAYQKRTDIIFKKLAAMQDQEVTAFEVKALIGEYDFASKMTFQMQDVSEMMKGIGELYVNDERVIDATDAQYGHGASCFIGRVIMAFYK